jgi:hypothetical protein
LWGGIYKGGAILLANGNANFDASDAKHKQNTATNSTPEKAKKIVKTHQNCSC